MILANYTDGVDSSRSVMSSQQKAEFLVGGPVQITRADFENVTQQVTEAYSSRFTLDFYAVRF